MKPRPKIVFLNRKHPQSIGGIQRHISRLHDGLSNSYDIESINWKGPEWGAPIYLPLFYYKSIRNGADILHCDDAVTSLIGRSIKRNSAKKIVAAVHGLDVTMPIPWYQNRLRAALPVLDKVVCISSATADQVRLRGVPDEKIAVIPSAAEKVGKTLPKDESLYRKLRRHTGIDFRNRKVLFSLGRPIRRKGFDFFITDVFPHLPDNYVYVAAGPAPETPLWIKAVKPLIGKEYHRLLVLASGCDSVHERLMKLSSHPRVHYLNGVSEDLREALFSVSDLFIMPNRRVDGDMEGFGVVALEAAARGVPVVATGIEGITDAVIDGGNGYCAREGDIGGMIEIIRSLAENPEKLREFGIKAREFTETNFSSTVVHGRYAKVFDELLNGDGPDGESSSSQRAGSG
jgi:phosphatidylinositol alpha-1,6-mannosyltransferase